MQQETLSYTENDTQVCVRARTCVMGSPFASIIAEILQHMYTKMQRIIDAFDTNGKWMRYVDDGLYNLITKT